MEAGCQNSTTFPEEHSRVGSKTEGAEPWEGMFKAPSGAPGGHKVADARRGAETTVTRWEALPHVGEKSPEGVLSAPIDRTWQRAQRFFCMMRGANHPRDGGQAIWLR